MKILLIDNAGLVYKKKRFYCVEGTGKFAAELVSLGVDVTMYGQKVIIDSSVSAFDIEANGIKTAGLWRKKNRVLNYLELYANAIKYVLRSDFVYIFYPNSFRYIAFVCSLLGKKYGLYIRGDKGLEDETSKKIYKRASVVLTVSKMFSDMVNNVTLSKMSETIRPMLSYDDRDIIKGREYHNKNKYEVLFLCRIQKQKGIIELLDAIRQLKESGNSCFHLTVAGDGDYLEQAQKESKVMGLEDAVSFTGGIYDNKLKANLFKNADLYVLPTYYNEGFPRTLYEAMIFGTPIITTLVAGIPALMKDGENCKALEPQSVKSIMDALTYAINNYGDMGRLAMNATEMVAKIVNHKRPSHARQLYDKITEYERSYLEQ